LSFPLFATTCLYTASNNRITDNALERVCLKWRLLASFLYTVDQTLGCGRVVKQDDEGCDMRFSMDVKYPAAGREYEWDINI